MRKAKTKKIQPVIFTIKMSGNDFTGKVEIETYKGLIIGTSTFVISLSEDSCRCEKEYFWLSIAGLYLDITRLFKLFAGKDVTIELDLENPGNIDMTESERRILLALCDIFRSHESVLRNR